MKDIFYKALSVKSIALYLIALVTVSIVFRDYFMGWHWILWGVGAVAFFFVGSWLCLEKSKNMESRRFLFAVFAFALIIRVLYAWLMCYYYTFKTGIPLEYNASDSLNYHHNALIFCDIIKNGQLGEFFSVIFTKHVVFSDLGYVITLGFVYSIFGPNILIPHVLHSLLSAYICVLVYRFADRRFDNRTARIASVMSAFMPLFIYYCGLHLKEIDFAFFLVLCIERIDFVIRERKILIWNIFLILFSLLMIFLYRISTGVCLILSFVLYIIVNKEDTIPLKVKIISIASAIAVSVCLMLSGIGYEIMFNFNSAFHDIKYNFQFLPGAFVLPLPKFTCEGNENLKLINGMVFVKNIIGFFAMYSFVIAYREKKLREISLVALVPITYLAIVSSVSFFSKERFYLPALPCLVLLASYAISHFEKKDIKWFNSYLAVLFVAMIIWSYYNVNSL